MFNIATHGRRRTDGAIRAPAKMNPSRGQALVEFAIVIPLFLVLLFGVLEFGFMLYSQMTVSNATREAARAATVDPDPGTISPLVQGTVQSSSAGLVAANLVTSALCEKQGTSSFVSCDSTFKQGDTVKVSVTYTYHTFFPLFFGSTFHLGQTVEMALW